MFGRQLAWPLCAILLSCGGAIDREGSDDAARSAAPASTLTFAGPEGSSHPPPPASSSGPTDGPWSSQPSLTLRPVTAQLDKEPIPRLGTAWYVMIHASDPTADSCIIMELDNLPGNTPVGAVTVTTPDDTFYLERVARRRGTACTEDPYSPTNDERTNVGKGTIALHTAPPPGSRCTVDVHVSFDFVRTPTTETIDADDIPIDGCGK